MSLRHNFLKSSPAIAGKLFEVQALVEKTGLDPKLIEFVRLRASQINGWNRLSIAFRLEPGSLR